MVKCVNEQCENRDKIIKENPASCPVCGMNTEVYKAPVRSDMGVGAIIASLAAILLFYGTRSWWTGPAVAVGSIIVAFVSKSKPAIVITFLSFAAIVALFINFVFLS